MPRSTFYNLSQERQEEIIRTCFEEFTSHAYKNASISRVVLKLGIAKGSFYRYFESKKELYLFLIDQATALRMEHVKELFELPSGDFFTSFEENLEMVARFNLSHPLQSAFLDHAMKEESDQESGNVLIHSKELMIELLTPVIEKSKHEGSLRTDIRSDLIAYSIVQIQLGITDLLTIRHHTDQEIQKTIKAFSAILANGLAKK